MTLVAPTGGRSSRARTSPTLRPRRPPTDGPVDESQTVVQAKVDLPDIDFPSTRYYWTVVPVDFQYNPTNDTTSSKEKKGYVDVETPQDACQAGRVASFGKESDGVRTGNGAGTPFVSGLSPDGRFLNSTRARPTVYSTPLVAWQPATGATAYQVQWSKTRYPWRAARNGEDVRHLGDPQPSVGHVVLPDPRSQPDADPTAEMAWSLPVAIKVAAPKFTISGG